LKRREAETVFGGCAVSIVSIASVKWRAMGLTNEDIWLALYIIFSFVLFVSGLFLGASLSPARERKEREPRHARFAAAEAKARGDGTKRSANLPVVVIALVVAFGLIALDHFKGRFLPDEFYTAHRNLIAKGP
jgi:hypothetical protein